MELEEMKAAWQQEKAALENRVSLNEKYINDLIIQKSKSRFTTMLDTAIWGRNLTLVYAAISVWGGLAALPQLSYSVPAFLGAAAMLFSFWQHRGLKKFDFTKMDTLTLQKNIAHFRIHTARFAKYDVTIVVFWIFTITPVIIKKFLPLDFDTEPFYYSGYFPVYLLVILLMCFFAGKVYDKWNTDLGESEQNLANLKAFEEQ